ncbi:hypothetical protein TrST_g7320 [Triparma strigata]|uniref:Uncharacterized protein n=1 Tax=Triparma strigata TaxID=1606541 RepID=A0A9W7BQ18_9STRA|nr:hypothetical protein TrST_g7320 [Triparma strigata]
MNTDDFRRLFVEFVPVDTLVTMRLVEKKWLKVVEKKLTEFEDEPYGEMIVHRGNDVRDLSNEEVDALRERHSLLEQVVFLLNITKVGDGACYWAVNLVVVEIPKGIESIGTASFDGCSSLKDVKFPKSLSSIGEASFAGCSSLEKVDLLQTQLQEISKFAFADCSELKSMTIPDSLQKVGEDVFQNCFKLVFSRMDVYDTKLVVRYLRRLQHFNNFMKMDKWRKLFVGFLPFEILMKMRQVEKKWLKVVDEFVGGRVESGQMMLHGGKDVYNIYAQHERPALVKDVVFLQNITKVGNDACRFAVNLVVVEIPEGVESIGSHTFADCRGLNTASFPTSLRLIGEAAFFMCSSLDNVDLLHTQLRALGDSAFQFCSELQVITIPSSLQTLGVRVFWDCSKLVPSHLRMWTSTVTDTEAVVEHLRSLKHTTPPKAWTSKTPNK